MPLHPPPRRPPGPTGADRRRPRSLGPQASVERRDHPHRADAPRLHRASRPPHPCPAPQPGAVSWGAGPQRRLARRGHRARPAPAPEPQPASASSRGRGHGASPRPGLQRPTAAPDALRASGFVGAACPQRRTTSSSAGLHYPEAGPLSLPGLGGPSGAHVPRRRSPMRALWRASEGARVRGPKEVSPPRHRHGRRRAPAASSGRARGLLPRARRALALSRTAPSL